MAGCGRFLRHAPQHHGALPRGLLNGKNRPKTEIVADPTGITAEP
jgi:hypothetical protein